MDFSRRYVDAAKTAFVQLKARGATVNLVYGDVGSGGTREDVTLESEDVALQYCMEWEAENVALGMNDVGQFEERPLPTTHFHIHKDGSRTQIDVSSSRGVLAGATIYLEGNHKEKFKNLCLAYGATLSVAPRGKGTVVVPVKDEDGADADNTPRSSTLPRVSKQWIYDSVLYGERLAWTAYQLHPKGSVDVSWLESYSWGVYFPWDDVGNFRYDDNSSMVPWRTWWDQTDDEDDDDDMEKNEADLDKTLLGVERGHWIVIFAGEPFDSAFYHCRHFRHAPKKFFGRQTPNEILYSVQVEKDHFTVRDWFDLVEKAMFTKIKREDTMTTVYKNTEMMTDELFYRMVAHGICRGESGTKERPRAVKDFEEGDGVEVCRFVRAGRYYPVIAGMSRLNADTWELNITN
eukprot:GFYU01001107.1.p1 GENE.GFYU01001107.1~~GFYU01001107.1.p1  ORF type:complete len:405 (+),score=78.96 GFYU01001107.1:102-1316(+)